MRKPKMDEQERSDQALAHKCAGMLNELIDRIGNGGPATRRAIIVISGCGQAASLLNDYSTPYRVEVERIIRAEIRRLKRTKTLKARGRKPGRKR